MCEMKETDMKFPTLEYYNREKYRFVLGSVGTRNKIMNDLVSVEDAIANGAEKVV